ncbi:MAG TPA: aromatic ring-hydroxylating dioxygenase subunit alpha [Dehalococcoidia bacterium]|nr:aromatic ring-hydroxylating dioxygenase subunit alpha [Dehalococcoidia bacterium]
MVSTEENIEAQKLRMSPFEFVPKLGFREYWYPGIEAKRVGRKKPVYAKMLGEDLVFFRDKDDKVVALSDWCPHRGARLSLGVSEFKGTITCPYHGYTFDGSGRCVAGIIDSPDSPVLPAMTTRSYPTEERYGIVFVWMGKTDPVPLDEDLPGELADPQLTGRRFMRTKVWESNWTEPMAQGIDFHEFYLHRQLNFWRLFHWRLPFFRPRMAYTGGVKVVEEGENYVNAKVAEPLWGQGYHPGVDGKWPRHAWWRKLPRLSIKAYRGEPWVSYDHNIQLPSIIRTTLGSSVHMRWMVPINEDESRVWTFTYVRKARTPFGSFYQALWYYLWRKWDIIVFTNELEDLVVFKKDRLNFETPQMLGPMDSGLSYFRRRLARRARDYQRLGLPGQAAERSPARADGSADGT